MKKKLTTKYIDTLKPPAAKRYEIRDEMVTGFMIRVSHVGNKVFYLSTRIDGKIKCIKIGEYPIVSLSEARQQAQFILRDITLGTYGD